MRESSGRMITVTDKEILAAQRLLAKEEAIFAQPAGAVSLAGLLKLDNEGLIDSTDRIVCDITGHGLKDISSVKTKKLISKHVSLENLKKALT